ncbi:MAG: hypothetical protein QXY39_01830 [Thermofilaceae archaeon]
MKCTDQSQCFALVRSFEWNEKARPVASGYALVQGDILSMGKRVRVYALAGGSEKLVFEGLIVSLECKSIPGAMLCEFEASDYLYMLRYLQLHIKTSSQISLSDLMTVIVQQLNERILGGLDASLGYMKRDIEESVKMSGEYMGSASDIMDYLHSELGLSYWTYPVEGSLTVFAVKALTYPGMGRDTLELELIGHNTSSLTLATAGMLKSKGAMKSRKGVVLKLRSKPTYVQLGPYKIQYSELCTAWDGKPEPCIVIDEYGFDLSQEPTLIYAVKLTGPGRIGDGIIPVSVIEGEIIPVSVLIKRGEKRDGRLYEDSRYDYTLDIDYWRRFNGNLRMFLRDELSEGYVYVHAYVYKEVTLMPQLASRIVELSGFRSVDEYPYSAYRHGDTVHVANPTGDSVIDSLLFQDEPEGEGTALLFSFNATAVLRDGATVMQIPMLFPGLLVEGLGRLKSLRYSSGGMIEAVFGPEGRMDILDFALKMRKEIGSMRVEFSW